MLCSIKLSFVRYSDEGECTLIEEGKTRLEKVMVKEPFFFPTSIVSA